MLLKKKTSIAENVFGDVDAIVKKLVENIEVFCYQARPFYFEYFFNQV